MRGSSSVTYFYCLDKIILKIHLFCERLANEGKIVIVAALDGTFERKPFNKILELIPFCEKVKKLIAICYYCKEESGAFTKRTVESKESKNL
jgi:thymidine kinase